GYGSGFLVAPRVVMTNYHVMEDIVNHHRDAATMVRFGYELGMDGKKQPGRAFHLADPWLLAWSPVKDFDYALIRLDAASEDSSHVEDARHFLPLKDHAFVKDEPLIILQHPAAKLLKLAFGVVVEPEDGPCVSYTVNTEGGSSG